MISLEKIDNRNLDEALRLNAIIFPKYCAKNNYLESIEGKTNSVFWIEIIIFRAILRKNIRSIARKIIISNPLKAKPIASFGL